MELGDILNALLLQLLVSVPALLFWTGVIIFGTIMLRRGGSSAEWFLVVAGFIELSGVLLGRLQVVWQLWIVSRPDLMIDHVYGAWVSGLTVFLRVVNMAGILCLVYAFWLEFKKRIYGQTQPVA